MAAESLNAESSPGQNGPLTDLLGQNEITDDEVIEFAVALEKRRILEQIKQVAKIHPAEDMPTPFQTAWQTCCKEIFFRATEEQWSMKDDEIRFNVPK